MALKRAGGIRDWVIYTITNPNGRVYVGKTFDMAARIRSYKCESSVSQQPLVYRSFKKYGFENHRFDIIDTFTSDNDYCKSKEMFWIRTYMSNMNKYPEQKGMNLTDGGDGTLGFKKSDAERAAMVIRYTGRKQSDEQKRKNSELHKGNKYCLGRKHTQETKDKMSAVHKGKKYGLGLKRSQECKDKMSAIRKGVKDTEAVRKIKHDFAIRVHGKPIIVLDLNGSIIGEYKTQIEAAIALGMNQDTVLRRLKYGNNIPKKRSKYNKYIFKYKSDYLFYRFQFQRRVFKLKDVA